jgi:hypothetical protein
LRNATTTGVELQHVVLHGGWEGSAECNVWVYVLMLRKYYMISARALAGWPNARSQVYPPRLTHILAASDEPNQQRIHNFIDELFNITHDDFGRDGQHRVFVETIVASFLRFHSEMERTYGTTHVDMHYFNSIAARYELRVADLASSVLADFNLRNAAVSHTDINERFDGFATTVTSEMGAMKAQFESLSRAYREEVKARKGMEAKLQMWRDETIAQNRELTLHTKAIAEHLATAAANSPRKRVRQQQDVVDGETEHIVEERNEEKAVDVVVPIPSTAATPHVVVPAPAVNAFAVLARGSSTALTTDLSQLNNLSDVITTYCNNNFCTFSTINSTIPGMDKNSRAIQNKRTTCNRALAVMLSSGLSGRIAEWKIHNLRPTVSEDRSSWTTGVSLLALEASTRTMNALDAVEKHLDVLFAVQPDGKVSKDKKKPTLHAIDRRRGELINRIKLATNESKWSMDHADVLPHLSLVRYLLTPT